MTPARLSGLAVAAGYAGLFALLVAPAPLAFVLGLLALRDLQMNPAKQGRGRAVFGLIAGAAGTAVLLAGLLVRMGLGPGHVW